MLRNVRVRLAVSSSFICMMAAHAAPGLAQTTEAQALSPMIDEIIVTAQRRAENLQKVPIAVSAVTGDQLRATGAANTQDIANVVPGLTIQQSQGFALPHIRGVGNSAVGAGVENSVALYIDGVYIASAPASVLSLSDVRQVEVIKGPQGTLFGRNATGGLIQVTTEDPGSITAGRINLGLASYRTITGDLFVTGPLTSGLGASLAVHVSHQGTGWGKNLTTGQDVYDEDLDLAARAKIVADLPGDIRATAGLDYQRRRSSLAVTLGLYPGTPDYYYGPRSVPANPYDVTLDKQPQSNLEAGGASLKLERTFGSVHVMSLSAYRRSSYSFDADFDLGPAPINYGSLNQQDRQFTQELQAQGKIGKPLTWTAGLFYLASSASNDPLQLYFNGPAINPFFPLTQLTTRSRQRTRSIAGYVQATLALTDTTHLTLGARWTDEERRLNATTIGSIYYGAPIPLSAPTGKFDVGKPTWRAAIDQQITPDVMVYASYNRGFKSGGFNPGNPSAPPFATERLDAFEIGAKVEAFDRRLRLNGAIFRYDYKNIQVSRYINGVAEIYNGAAAKIYGLDLDAELVVATGLKLRAGVELVHDRFTDFPTADYFVNCPTLPYAACPASAKGNRLPQTPDASATAAIEYRLPLREGALTFTVADAYKSRFFYGSNNSIAQPGYHLLSAQVVWEATRGLSISAWAKNLTDSRYTTNIGTALNAVAVAYGAPRTFGGTVGFSF